MKYLINAWVLLNEIIWGFEVQVSWDNKHYFHPARNKREAQEWMGMYPNEASINVLSYGDDRVVMARHPVVCA